MVLLEHKCQGLPALHPLALGVCSSLFHKAGDSGIAGAERHVTVCHGKRCRSFCALRDKGTADAVVSLGVAW